ncbi:STAS domain-containing protein [Chungangia koreensis]|uniref:STAS domain-containing protein n=1 Tax=Chungangia koreensis TaxID=752657 RepID=A0ABV8X7I3_9LACT
MNRKTAVNVRENFDEIFERWYSLIEKEKDQQTSNLMSDKVIDETLREFAGLMVSSLFDVEQDEMRVRNVADKVVKFGWSITFVVKVINQFAQVVYMVLVEKELIDVHDYTDLFSTWISPMSESIIANYSDSWERTVNLQKIALQELSASLIPVIDRVSVMPLVGTIDTERAKLILENLLEGVVKHRAEVVLLDITGVPLVDTMVAHHLIQAADAVRLIGSKCIIVGIRPEIAQTIVTLGINLSEFYTASTLQLGMEQALNWTDRKIVGVNVDEYTNSNS